MNGRSQSLLNTHLLLSRVLYIFHAGVIFTVMQRNCVVNTLVIDGSAEALSSLKGRCGLEAKCAQA